MINKNDQRFFVSYPLYDFVCVCKYGGRTGGETSLEKFR